MRFPLLVHLLLAAICITTSLAAIEAAASEKTEAKLETTKFHRNGRAFLPDQGCSLVVARGWHKAKDGDSTILYVPGPKGQHGNVIISVWEAEGTLDEIAAEIGTKLEAKGYKILKPEPFVTFSDIKGLRLGGSAPEGQRVSVQYLFPAWEGRYITLTGTFNGEEFPDFDKALALSAKTLHLLDRPHGLPAEPGLRFGDKRASIQVPRGWDARADVTATNAFGPPVIHHGEQIFLKLDRSELPLRDYANADGASEDKGGVKLEEFPTADAGTGIKVRGKLRMDDGQEQLTATYYFDGPPGLKIIIGTAANTDQWPTIEKLFDACVKTLKIGKER